MKTSISSYSFQCLINQGTENQFSVIRRAKALGFDAIEFTTLIPHDGTDKESYAKKLRQEAERNELAISCYSVGADMLGQGKEAVITELKKEVDIACLLGTDLMRHDIAFAFPEGSRGYRGYNNCVIEFAEICRVVTEYAATKGIRTCTENHGYFSQDSIRVEQLVNTVAHNNFGLLVDTGNFLCVDEDLPLRLGGVHLMRLTCISKIFYSNRGKNQQHLLDFSPLAVATFCEER